ncbi:MAG: metal ABC transporter substrate-binding protein [Merdibacter sp.]
MKLVKMTLCLCLSLMTLCGCRATHDQVLVTCYPLQYLVEQIAQDRVSCVLLSENTLIQRAQIRDDYQELLAQSDALLYLGGLESYYEAYADEITDSRIEQVNLVDQLGNFPFLRYGENNETQPWYAGDAFDDVDMYYSDPTLWMDAVTMCGMAACIRDYLSERYPAYAQEFADNYDALEIALSRLDARYQQLREKQIRVAVMTPNFGHWQNYGIQVYPVCLSRYGALPTMSSFP